MDVWRVGVDGESEGRVWLACQTPTTALAMRMSRMTNGSTNAVIWSSDSSNQASTCDTSHAVTTHSRVYVILLAIG